MYSQEQSSLASLSVIPRPPPPRNAGSSSLGGVLRAAVPMPPKKVDGAKIGALIAVIGDEETVTGMLLAGVGDKERGGRSNFMVVDPSKTTPAQIQEAFHNFTKRPDVAVLVINQYIASTIRETVDSFEGKSPAILEIPSKEHPYDPSQDAVHRRTKLLLGIRD